MDQMSSALGLVSESADTNFAIEAAFAELVLHATHGSTHGVYDGTRQLTQLTATVWRLFALRLKGWRMRNCADPHTAPANVANLFPTPCSVAFVASAACSHKSNQLHLAMCQ
jgi:hypothetical protein